MSPIRFNASSIAEQVERRDPQQAFTAAGCVP